MNPKISFDSSLPSFADAVRRILGNQAIDEGLFLRDPTGALTFIMAAPPTDAEVQALKQSMSQLSPYVRSDRGFLATMDEFDEPDLERLALRTPVKLSEDEQDRFIRLLDRRVIGQDWTRQPSKGWRVTEPARFVFWSLKGGVGRTTSLAVTGAHLARSGKRVLALDLDLEAPGLGSVLLSPEARPAFGTLDWFVEYAAKGSPALSADDIISAADVGGADGLLHVVPALGRLGSSNPQNVVAKLGRAYLEDIDDSGTSKTFLDKTKELTDLLLSDGRYDILLVDARAGLNEATAAALLGLGADVLMFGTNTPQTFEGYSYCLSHLRMFEVPADDDWRLRFKMVHARASASVQSRELFRDRAFDLFNDHFYDNEAIGAETASFTYGVDDTDGPHAPWIVLEDERFRDFDPLAAPDLLTGRVTDAIFGDLLDGISKRASP